MPKLLGGSGHYLNSWKDFPYQEHAPGLKYYYLILMGYHCGNLIAIFLQNKRNDFIEMGLHHILAVQLIGGSYLLNIWELGSIVFLVHDMSDAMIAIPRALGNTIFKTATVYFFWIMLAVWVYTRMTVFPYLIYFIFTSDANMGWSLTLPTLGALLSCLFILHCYWFTLFVNMVAKYFKFGSVEDTQNKIHPEYTKNDKYS